MITILTPSKTMNFDEKSPMFAEQSELLFADRANLIRTAVTKCTDEELKRLMHISDDLVRKTRDSYGSKMCKQALWAYDGDIFKGVQAKTINQATADFAQEHILIPSAVYGLVRPYDMISPYRLEMKAKLAVDEAKNLYDFWGNALGTYIDARAGGEVLMLSSAEYARAITPHLSTGTQIITPVFIDKKPNGQESQVAIYNKMMRGVMARWVIDFRIDGLAEVHAFSAHGYSYSPVRSTPNRPVYYRQSMKPLVF